MVPRINYTLFSRWQSQSYSRECEAIELLLLLHRLTCFPTIFQLKTDFRFENYYNSQMVYKM